MKNFIIKIEQTIQHEKICDHNFTSFSDIAYLLTFFFFTVQICVVSNFELTDSIANIVQHSLYQSPSPWQCRNSEKFKSMKKM